MNEYRQHTQSPVTTGTSVVGIAYKDGVILAADQLASYGSLARFRDVQRLKRVNASTVVGCTGDFADFQFLYSAIEQKVIEEESAHDGHTMSPEALYSWLTRVQYNRRSKFDPLWCTWVVAGVTGDKPFLGNFILHVINNVKQYFTLYFSGFVDKLGTAYESPIIATGFGAYLATPMLREAAESRTNEMTEEEAKNLIHRCMTVLYYRDARSFPKVINDSSFN